MIRRTWHHLNWRLVGRPESSYGRAPRRSVEAAHADVCWILHGMHSCCNDCVFRTDLRCESTLDGPHGTRPTATEYFGARCRQPSRHSTSCESSPQVRNQVCVVFGTDAGLFSRPQLSLCHHHTTGLLHLNSSLLNVPRLQESKLPRGRKAGDHIPRVAVRACLSADRGPPPLLVLSAGTCDLSCSCIFSIKWRLFIPCVKFKCTSAHACVPACIAYATL